MMVLLHCLELCNLSVVSDSDISVLLVCCRCGRERRRRRRRRRIRGAVTQIDTTKYSSGVLIKTD
jgi:hypothetical protein